jgi:hypothetical protein
MTARQAARYQRSQPPRTAQQAPLFTSLPNEESGASCGEFIIPRERDKKDENGQKSLSLIILNENLG